jgi:hypothetical protein
MGSGAAAAEPEQEREPRLRLVGPGPPACWPYVHLRPLQFQPPPSFELPPDQWAVDRHGLRCHLIGIGDLDAPPPSPHTGDAL